MEQARQRALDSTDPPWEESRQHLDAALASLSVGRREAVLRFYLQAKSQTQVAVELGCSVDAVKTRVHEGLEGLRKYFDRKGIICGTVALASVLAFEATASEPALVATCVQSVLTPPTTPRAAALAHKVLTATKIKIGVLTAAGLVSAGFFLTAVLVLGAEPAPTTVAAPSSETPLPAKQVPVVAVGAQKDGRIADHVPLSLLLQLQGAIQFRTSVMTLRGGRFHLSSELRSIAAVDPVATMAIEQELAAIVDGFRLSLIAHPPAITRVSTGMVIVEVAGISSLRQTWINEIDRAFEMLVSKRRLSVAQAAYVKSLVAPNIVELLQGGIDDPSPSLLIYLDQGDVGAQRAFSVWFGSKHARDSHESKSSQIGSWPEMARLFLACAGLADNAPLPDLGSPVSAPEPVEVRSDNSDQVPLTILAAGSDVILEHGIIALTPAMREICDLDERQSAAISTAYTGIYDVFRRRLASYPPKVTIKGPTEGELDFVDMKTALASLPIAAAHALDALVAKGLLSKNQAEYVQRISTSSIAKACWGFGELQHVAIGFIEKEHGGLFDLFNGNRTIREWNCRYRIEVNGNTNSGGHGGGALGEEYRAFLTFLPFAADEALPPVLVNPSEQQMNDPHRLDF